MKLEGSEVMRRVKKREKCLKKQEDGETCALRLRQTERGREGEEAGAGGRGGGKKSDSPTAAPNGSSGAEREEGSAEEEERKE